MLMALMLMVEKTQKAARWLVRKDSTGESPLTAVFCAILMAVAILSFSLLFFSEGGR